MQQSESEEVGGKAQARSTSKKGAWQKTPTPCLAKYVPAGTYYLRARIGGMPHRECLDTSSYEIARRKLGDRLHELRLARGGPTEAAPRNLKEALEIVRAKVDADPSIKERTREDYREAIARLLPGGTAQVPSTPLSRLSAADLEPWWNRACSTYGPQRANELLMLVKRALRFARAAGSVVGDPAEDLKRQKVRRTRLDLLTVAQFRQLVEHVRSRPFASRSRDSGDWIEFQAYSGLRPAEMVAIKWEHVDEAAGVVWVHGGATGTKNREVRPVPIISEMAKLLARMREGRECKGPMFSIKLGPRDALQNACRRLGFPHLRIYDLRHLFATTCNSAGVDVPTFAKWLGHKDGGALAMRTYVHPHDEHSQQSAAKVDFSA